MSIEKVNTAMPVTRNLSFKGEEAAAPKEVEVDEEKSSSMNKKIGLCAAAAIAIGGIIYFAKRGKAPSNVPSTGRPQPRLQRLLRVPVRLHLSR